MSSLNGDVFVIRNQRSTSQVSIYNYPEHLNPFYEDDNHKRLRFWKLSKNSGNSERRNSFSIVGLKDVWSFKSFRLKKKSSTLGINKTSESPPTLRREVFYDPISRNTLTNEAAISNGNNNFLRNVPMRNSLQTLYHPQTLEKNYNGFGLNRNDQYRSTIQTGVTSYPKQKVINTAARYTYGGSATPQPLRNSDSRRNESLERGSSQISVYSTNPFETDTEENDVSFKSQIQTSSTPKKLQRKKRRAPAPPVAIELSDLNTDPAQERSLQCAQDDNSLKIVELTAEIEKFVNTSNADADKLEDKGNQKVTTIADMEIPGKNDNKSVSKETENTFEILENEKCDILDNKQTEVHKKSTARENEEIGHIECIHIHLDSSNPIRENSEPSRVTSFKKNIVVDNKNKIHDIQINSQIESTNENDKEAHSASELTISECKDENKITNAEKVENQRKDRTITFLEEDKNFKSFKPTFEEKPKISAVPIESKLSNKNNNDLGISKLGTESCVDIEPVTKLQRNLQIDPSNQLKIVESEEDSSFLVKCKRLEDNAVHGSAIDKNQNSSITEIYRAKPTSHLEWKKSTLAPLETNVPPEKRKSVKDIIESINRSQKLLGASANKHQTSQNCLSLINNNERQHAVDVVFGRPTQNTQIDPSESNNLDGGFKNLDESQRVIPHMIKEISATNNSHTENISNSCAENKNERFYGNQTAMDDEHLNKENNNDVFQKCKINKQVYTNRESSPTASNLDWNPVPKPKRSSNTSST